MPKPYFVYIIKAFGYYKIGKAFNVQTAIPVPVELVLTVQTAKHGLERALHNRFEPKRQQGEWFILDTGDLEWIAGFVSSSSYL